MNKRPYISPFCCVRPIRAEGMICVSMKVNSNRAMMMEDYDMWGNNGIWNNTGSTDGSGEGNGDYGYGTEGF